MREGQPARENKVPERNELPGVLVGVDHRVWAETTATSDVFRLWISVDVVGLVVETDAASLAEGMTEPGSSRAGNADEREPIGPRRGGRGFQFRFRHASTFLHWSTMSGRP